jgi:hypothetical protein
MVDGVTPARAAICGTVTLLAPVLAAVRGRPNESILAPGHYGRRGVNLL